MADKVRDPFLSKICADYDGSEKVKTRNKDLAKTELCKYFPRGKCGFGSDCQFAHSSSEIRHCPNLTKTQLCTNFMKGRCTNKNCAYAHGEADLVKPPSFKKKPCTWFQQGKCRHGVTCGFIHDLSQSAAESEPFKKSQQKPWTNDCEFDYEASTDTSPSQVESDITMRSTGPIPQEHLVRTTAGRGSAPLQQQVKSMSSAIGDLQVKLAQVQGCRQSASNTTEGHALQKRGDELRHAIQQLCKQCEAETQLHANQQPILRQKESGTDGKKNSKGSYQFGIRAVLCVLFFALMVMLQLAVF